jgi:hypothetical protein
MPQPLTSEIINAAIVGFEQQKVQIDAQIAALRAMLPSGIPAAAITPDGSPRRRRKLSAAARARIAEAQRKRWAEAKKRSEPPALAAVPKRKRKLSAAGRKAISEATKRRWALKRAEATKAARKAAGK